MKNTVRIQKMCIAALLCAISILIPIISPIKIQIPPMSFTLGSHVAIFVAIFISPAVALTVEIGATIGFLLAGFPPVVILRAASQIVFVAIGAYLLAKHPSWVSTQGGVFTFALLISVIHGICEALVVTGFYLAGVTYPQGFIYTVLGLVGIGTVVHSMIDFYLALLIWVPVSKAVRLPCSYTTAKV